MATESTTVHVIGRCPTRGCRNTRRNSYPATIVTAGRQHWTEWGITSPTGKMVYPPAFYSRREDSRASTILVVQPRPDATDATVARLAGIRDEAAAMQAAGWICADCDRFMKPEVVKGVYSRDTTCNSSCTTARGRSCTCSCGGAKHGAAYEVQEEDDAAPTPAAAQDDNDDLPSARWKLLGQVSRLNADRWGRMLRAMRRVHGLPEQADVRNLREIIDARMAQGREGDRWQDTCRAYLHTYAVLMTEDGVTQTAACEPAPGSPPIDAWAALIGTTNP